MSKMSLEIQGWARFFRGGSPGEGEEWQSLRRERDPEFFFENLLQYGGRMERQGDLARAAEVYQELTHIPGEGVIETSMRTRASRRLDAIAGRGGWAPRAEFLMSRLAGQAADPSTLLAMGVAGAVYRMTRLMTLSRLAAAPGANLWTRGVGARVLAGLTGVALEAPAFALTGRLGAEAMGIGQDWSTRGLVRDLASNYLVLGGMRLAGLGTATAFRRLAGTQGAIQGRFARQASEVLFQQGGLLGGILLGHSLERWAGLRRPGEGETTLVDSLAMLLQFHVAGRFTQRAFGEGFSSWERSLERRGETLSASSLISGPPNASPWGESFLRPAFAAASLETEGPMLSRPVLMTMRPNSPGGGGVGESSLRVQDLIRKELQARVRELQVRMAEDPSSVKSALWREESAWLSETKLDDVQVFFQNLLRLRSFYARNMRGTGIEGLQWLGEAQKRLFVSVRERELYSQFLVPTSSGVPRFDFPMGMEAPSTLSEIAGAGNVLFETNVRTVAQHQNLHYMRISDLLVVQEVVSESKLAEYRVQVLAGKNFKQYVQITFDPRKGRYQLLDGHHRTLAAHLEGQSYILGAVQQGFVNASKGHPVSEIRRVSREEYERVAALNQFGAGMSESMYLESFHETGESPPAGGGGLLDGQARRPWSEVLRRMFSRR
ncbi:MAG: hypothetical protein K8R69_08595 [Deltaproteobacteria bacterium]|nr:hypothetical protein [Deltaproteobacteria bacterium]